MSDNIDGEMRILGRASTKRPAYAPQPSEHSGEPAFRQADVAERCRQYSELPGDTVPKGVSNYTPPTSAIADRIQNIPKPFDQKRKENAQV